MKNKIIRSICYFTDKPSMRTIFIINEIAEKLVSEGFEIQTKRVCSSSFSKIQKLDAKCKDQTTIFSMGTLESEKVIDRLDDLLKTQNTSFNIDLTRKKITGDDVKILFEIINKSPSKTFNFTYVFNNRPLTPFFPSASYVKNGFSIGLQPTDLAEGCQTLMEWLNKMKKSWNEIHNIFKEDSDFLGIDSSIAPLFKGKSSFINFIKKLNLNFSQSTTTDVYLRITSFLKNNNPKPVGLCGLMFPCLEDFELAGEYEKGNFPIERNIYLSLHSGLGIDTYPIGINELPERILEILNLIQKLSNKYKKPLSVRFVSDGKAKIGKKTNFKNQYLKNVIIRSL